MAQNPTELSKPPLSRIDILEYRVGQVDSTRLARMVEEAGIDFEPTEDFLETLQKGGAEEVLTTVLRKANHKDARTTDSQTVNTQLEEHLARGLEVRHKRFNAPEQEKAARAEVEDEFRRAVELDPGKAELHVGLGFALYSQPQVKIDASLEEFRLALRLKPDCAEAHNGMGLVFQYFRDFKGAESEFNEALRLAPDYWGAHMGLGIVLEMHDLDGAIAQYRQAIRLMPSEN